MQDKPQNELMKWAGLVLLSVVGVGVFLFCAANNFNLFVGIFGNDFWGYVMSILGLTTLDVAYIGWLVFGVSAAKGLFQRVAAWGAGGICLLLALSAAVSELVIKQNYVERPDWIGTMAIGSIIVGLVVNAIAIALSHSIDPDTMLAIRVGMKKDDFKKQMAEVYINVLGQSVQKAKGKMAAASDKLSEDVSQELFQDARRELLGYTPSGDNTPTPQWKTGNPALALGGGDSDFPQRERPASAFPRAAQPGPVLAARHTYGASDVPLPNFPNVERPNHRAPQPPRFEAGPGARPNTFPAPREATWQDAPPGAIKVEKYDESFDTPIRTDPEDVSPKDQAHQMRR